MRHIFLNLCAIVASLVGAQSGFGMPEAIDGRTASAWKAEPGWSPGKAAARHGVTDRDGWLEFSAGGGIMTWTIRPTAAQLAGGHRHVLLRYRAEGLAATGDYLLIARDGSPDWRHYLMQKMIVADGAEHVIGVDLMGFLPPDNIEQFALRLTPAPSSDARLLARIEFSEKLPEGAKVVGSIPVERKTFRIEAESLDFTAAPSWLPKNASADFRAEKTVVGQRLRAAGEGLSMRWTVAKPPAVDVATMPSFALRYRATGDFASGGYVLQGYVTGAQGKRESAHPMNPSDVDADGRWHVFRGKMEFRGRLETLALGVDCGGGPAEIEIDWLAFQSEPFLLPVSEELEFDVRSSAWSRGEGGFETLPPAQREGAGMGAVALARFGFGEWFSSRHITVGGIPFEVPEGIGTMAATGIIEEEAVTLATPECRPARELLLLIAATFPEREQFVHWQRESPLRVLTEPERLMLELEYRDGHREELLPIHGAKHIHGIGHGVAVYGIPLREDASLRRVALHDRMRNSGFAILGATLNRDHRRIQDPPTPPLDYTPATKAATAPAEFRFETDKGLSWGTIDSAMFGGPVPLKGQPVFSLKIDGRETTSAEWRVEKSARQDDGSFEAECSWLEGEMSLRARFMARRIDARSVILSLDMRNAGKAPVTGTLYFPKLSGLALGSVDDTWYLGGRTGCVINRLPCAWRDEIGETHALQLDGFFNPRMGAGIALMPRDLEGIFRWYHLGKDAQGGNYALEFLPETVAPDQGWSCVPVLIAAVPGDWREQVAIYKEWLSTWYRPAVVRKPWFSRVFGFPSYCPTQPFTRPVDERVDLMGQTKRIEEALGCRDYIHLFGWAITPEHGHWGAYDEYHQLGGLPRFVENVRKSQASGVPVGLYLDGYLVSTRAVKPAKEKVERWAIHTPDGKMLYHQNYDAHSMCPYVPAWREHLTAAYRRVANEVRPDGMYVDEFGKNMVSRICHAKDHGHPSPMGMSPGEWVLTRDIRAAVPSNIVLYCEYVPNDIMCQHLDGAFGHTALHGHRDGYDRFSPHYLNLQRFVQPDFKVFELIYYAPLKNGNWSLLKYPFFNGEGYYLTSAYPDADARSREFLSKAMRIQRTHADAFGSNDVEPLIPTMAPGLFANRFTGPKETVWTLLNANHRGLKGELLAVSHRPDATYRDAWADKPIPASVRDGTATLSLEIGPRAVGCIVAESGK